MRISELLAALALIALVGCGEPPAPTLQEVAAADDGIDLIECALGSGSQFGPDCSVERVGNGNQDLIVRHPDGGFQRFVQAADASSLATADGADEAVNSLRGDVLEVQVAGNRYRFPARSIGTNSGG